MTSDSDAPTSEQPDKAAEGELLRASPELAPIAVSLLLALWPEATVLRREGRLVYLWLDPLPPGAVERVKAMLQQLVDRAEWRPRHALVREVSDRAGTRLELLVPVAPDEYRGGPAMVGPFEEESQAEEFGERHAGQALTHDTYPVAGAWVTDLFDIPRSGWEQDGR